MNIPNFPSFMVFAVASVLALTCSLSSCKKDDTPPSNEQELVTRVTLTLKDSASGTEQTFAFNDPDGDGGAAPTIDSLRMLAGRTYFTSIHVYDAVSADTVINLTGEIEEESDAHEWFFAPSSSTLAIKYDETDKDANGIYVGLKTRWYATAAGNGTIIVTLKHQPGLKPSGPKPDGDQSKGETDVEVTFPYRIE